MTPRELEIVALVVDGLSNRQIGERLSISARTVTFRIAKKGSVVVRKIG